jgi:hypothetical protein
MRLVFLFLLLTAGFFASAQTTVGQFRYDTTKFLKVGGFNEVKIQNSTKDSVGGIFTNVGNGWGRWLKPRQVGDTLFIGLDSFIVVGGSGSSGIGQVVGTNGLSNVNDSTIRLGGTYSDSITHRELPIGSTTDQNTLNTTFVDVVSNRTLAQDKSVSDWIYWLRRGANALKWYNRQFYESDNDTAAQQYNATVNIFNRNTQDFSSDRFNYNAGGKATNMQYAGVYSINQLYPVKSTLIEPGWFGKDGANFAASMGFGKDSTYDIQFQPSSRYPVPISNFKSDIDLNRAVPSGYSRTMNGIGVSGYTAGWRSYQSGQGTASTSTPSYIGRITDFTSLGSVDTDPFNGQGFSKSDILARSEVDSVIGYHSRPKYTLQNETRNGYAIWQQGEHDYSYFEGKVRIRGNMPDRAGTDTMQQQFEVYGNTLLQGSNNLRFRGSATGTFPGMYWLLAPDTAGAQASIDFDANANRDNRTLIFATGTSGTATSGYPSTSGTGWRMEFRTGLNGVNRIAYWRNGNYVIGSGSSSYMDISRLTVVGDATITDTIFLRTTPLITSGSGYDVLVRSRSDSAVYALPYDSVSSGSGGSVNLGNTDLTQDDATRIFDVATQALYWNDIGEMRWYSDDGTTRIAALDGANYEGFWGDPSGQSFGFDADSLFLNNISRVTDTTAHQVVARTPGGGLVWISAGALAGAGSISFGTDNQVPYTNSTGTGFDYSANFTFDGSQLLMLAGSAASPTYSFSGDPNTGMYSSSGDVIGFATNGVRRIFFSNVGIGSDNAAGPLLTAAGSSGTAPGLVPNRTNVTTGIGSSSANVISLITSASSKADIGTSFIVNPGGLNFDFNVQGDTDANLVFADASAEGVGFGTATITSGSKVTVNGMLDVPGTEASTFRWNATATEVPGTTTYAAPTNYIGSSTNYALFTPDAWLRVSVNGTLYGIPAYLISTP